MLVRIPSVFNETLKAIEIRPNTSWSDDASTPVNLRFMSEENLATLEEALASDPAGMGVRRQISGWRKAAKDPANQNIANLSVLEGALVDYLVEAAHRGWLMTMSGDAEYWAVTQIKYYPAAEDDPACTVISLRARDYNGGKGLSIVFGGDDIKKKTLVDVLANNNLRVFTEDDVEEYDRIVDHFASMVKAFGKQVELTTSVMKERDWRRREDRDVDLQTLGGGRMVVNLKGLKPFNPGGGISRRGGTSSGAVNDGGNPFQRAAKDAGKEFSEFPLAFKIPCYHLEAHTDLSVHTENIRLYEYDDTIREKLVLPADQLELLDTLTDDLSLLQEDLVAGKSGGNVILLGGTPGLGKTLTAEVYAEACKVPLLKIHSGQLGTTPEQVEHKLKEFYQLAGDWGEVIVLLDEFDVFGRKRGTDLVQNAIVAVFLRTLEYQSSTIFLTTNLIEDMDDAIVSRCSALISYGQPEGENLMNMWKVLGEQFLPSLTEDMIKEVMETSEANLSGRDIKGILRLADRYERRGHEVTAALIKKCAGFRGIQFV